MTPKHVLEVLAFVSLIAGGCCVLVGFLVLNFARRSKRTEQLGQVIVATCVCSALGAALLLAAGFVP